MEGAGTSVKRRLDSTKNYGERAAYPAFAGYVPANPSELTRPISGWDGAFKVVFVNDPVDSNVRVISRAVRADQLPVVKNAVVELLRKITPSSKGVASVVTQHTRNRAAVRNYSDRPFCRRQTI